MLELGLKAGFGGFSSRSWVEGSVSISLILAWADQARHHSSVNSVPYLASLAVVGHQRDVLQMPRIQVLSKNNNFGGSRPAQN